MAELEKRNQFLSSLANLGNEFLNVFTSFGDMISGETLGFKADSKKSDVAAYFKKVHDKVEGTKTALNTMVDNMEKEGNPNASAVKTKVEELIKDKLNNIIEGAKKVKEAIVDTGDDLIGNVAAQGAGGAAAGDVNKLVEGIKGIVNIVLKNEGQHDAGDKNQATDGSSARTNSAGAGKLFAQDHAGGSADAKKATTDAAKAVGAVTGADILQAISNNKDAEKLAKSNAGNTAVNDAQNAKDATIAGAIALRAMAKSGKFANASDTNLATEIKGVAVSAVTKALDTLTIAIRKTIDEELKKVKEAMKINANDNPVNSETAAAAK